MKQTLFPLSLLVALLFVGIGCDRRPFKGDPAFDDKVLILENNPELLLVRMTKDSLADHPITDEASATDFLVRTLAQVYTVYGTVPDRERLEQCLAIFRSARKAQQQLETLYLLADIHRRNNDLRGELDIIQRSIDLAEAVNDPVWLFYLYSYLGDMYRREGDLVRFARYQETAKGYIASVPEVELDPHTRMLLARSELYTGQPGAALRLLLPLARETSEHHLRHAGVHRLLGMANFRLGRFGDAATDFRKSLTTERDTLHLFRCHTMLATCAFRMDSLETARRHCDLAAACRVPGVSDYALIDYYRLCTDLAGREGDTEGASASGRRLIEAYEYLVTKLARHTLDGAVSEYARQHEEQEAGRRSVLLLYLTAGVAVLLLAGLAVQTWRYRRERHRHASLRQSVGERERFEMASEEMKELVRCDLQLFRELMARRSLRQEKGQETKQASDRSAPSEGTDAPFALWDLFYRHIDFLFDGCYTQLVRLHPSLTEKEVQLCCLLAAGFRTDEIAGVWMQSVFSVHKCKTDVRKKLGVPDGGDITAFLRQEVQESAC